MRIKLSDHRTATYRAGRVSFRNRNGKIASGIGLQDLVMILTATGSWPQREPNPEREYREDVNNAAQGFVDDVRTGSIDGDLNDALHELIDGHGRVIYTYRAQQCLLFSSNDGEGIEQMGADSFDFKSGIPWSQLAYHAFMADVREEIDSLIDDIEGGATLGDYSDGEEMRKALWPVWVVTVHPEGGMTRVYEAKDEEDARAIYARELADPGNAGAMVTLAQNDDVEEEEELPTADDDDGPAVPERERFGSD